MHTTQKNCRRVIRAAQMSRILQSRHYERDVLQERICMLEQRVREVERELAGKERQLREHREYLALLSDEIPSLNAGGDVGVYFVRGNTKSCPQKTRNRRSIPEKAPRIRYYRRIVAE